MHLVPTGFPGHLSGYRFFSGTAPRSPIGLEEIERALLCRLALDPDQLLDDVINRFESGKTVLGDDAVAGRSAFFSIALGFVCLAIFSPSGGIFSPGRRQTKEMARGTECPDQRISRGYKQRADPSV
jgi:hypothetical protein